MQLHIRLKLKLEPPAVSPNWHKEGWALGDQQAQMGLAAFEASRSVRAKRRLCKPWARIVARMELK